MKNRELNINNSLLPEGDTLDSLAEQDRSLPKNWKIKKLGEVCEVQRGLTYSGKDAVDYSDNVVLRATNINLENSSLDFSELKFLRNDFKIQEKYKLKKGSLLICFSSGSKSHLGKVALVDKDYNYAFGGFIGQIIPRKEVKSKFLFYSLISENYKQYISELTDGVNINNLKIKDLQNFPIPIPSLPKQKHIVSILDKAFEAVDKAKANAEQNLKNAKKLFQSKLQAIFDNGKLKIENGEWEEKKLGEVCVKIETVNPKSEPEKEFVYIDVSSVNKETKIIEETMILLGKDAPSRARKLVKTDDVIFATVRPTHQRITLITNKYNNQVCSTGYYVLRPRKILNSRVIYYFLLTYHFNEKMKKLQKGASYPAVTNKEVESQIIPFPKSIEQQKQIVQRLDQLQSETKKLEEIYQKKLENLEELKKSVLQKAFNGEL